jgi:hypothetical protein
MVNPGAFQGSQREFLLAEKPAYAAGVDGGYAADALAVIQRRYFKRYPMTLSHVEEPTAVFLAVVDDNAPDPEEHVPDPDTMSEELYEHESIEAESRRVQFVYRKAVS